MAGAVDEESGVLRRYDAGDAADQQTAEGADPAVIKKSGDRRQDKPDKHGKDMNVTMLPAHERVSVEIRHVVQGGLRVELEKDPTHVGVEKTFADVVRIVVVVNVLMVAAMVARPLEDGVFESGRSEYEHHQAKRPFRFKGLVGEKAVITGRDAESSEDEHDEEHPEVEPVEAEEPKIDWQRGHGEQRRSDKERAADPINALSWKRENFHGSPMFA